MTEPHEEGRGTSGPNEEGRTAGPNEEGRDTSGVERILWVFIAVAVTVSLAALVLSWRTGTASREALDAGSDPGASPAARGEVGVPGSPYALRYVMETRAPVRSEPRSDAPVIDELDPGRLVRVRLEPGDWLPAVREDGQLIGWLEARHLSAVSPDGIPAPVEGASGVGAAGLDRLVGGVAETAEDAPADVPRVTVRLYEDAGVGEPVGSVVYWHEEGACTYALQLLERSGPVQKVAQVPEEDSCEPLGEIWITGSETEMTAVWYRADGSYWFQSHLTVD